MPRGKSGSNGVPVLPESSLVGLALFLGSGQADAAEIEHWDFRPELFRDVVLSSLAAGCAIQFGMNRDRTAVAVSLYDSGSRMPYGYHNDSEALGEKLEELIVIMRKYKAAQQK